MNVAELLGNPVTDPPDLAPRPTPPCTPATPIEATPTPQRRWQLVGTALVVAAVAAGGLIGWYAKSAANADPTTTVVDAAPVPQVGEIAELFTAMYLSGTTPTAGVASADLSTAASSGTWVNKTAAVRVAERSNGDWDVLVAVDALEFVDDAYQPTDLQYFTVTVSGEEGHAVVVTAPARVPRPISATAASAPVFAETVPPDQQAAIDAFLVGYLTGAKDVARYMAPAARVRMFAEPPYASIVVDSISADELGMARASLTATTASGATHVLTYVIGTTFAGGVWEVASISGDLVSR